MTHMPIQTDDPEAYFDFVRHRIVDIAMQGEPGFLQFTGYDDTPSCVYRDDDVTVVWPGGLTCIAVPSSGPSLTMRLADENEDLAGLVERICAEADLIMRDAADGYRLALAIRDRQGY